MKRTTLILGAVGAVVLVLLWYFFLFAPTSSDLSDTRDEVSELETQNQELENTIRRLKELSRNSVEQQARLRTLRAAIPTTPDLGEFILQANEIASASGIDWLSIAPTPPAATGGAGPTSTIAISIQVDGQFSAVLDYLNRLEDLERLVIVDTINVSTSGAEGEGGSGTTGGDSVTTGAPDLSVTLTGRMFTDAVAPAASGSTGSTGTTPTTPGGTTATTVPGAPTSSTVPSVPSTAPPAPSSGSSS
jgi:Tfp pilus assembly protein PilO